MISETFINLGALSIILFIVGIVLLILEMLRPGFGAFGITGIVILLIDIVISARSLIGGLILGAAISIVVTAMFIIVLVCFSKGKFPKILTNDSEPEQIEQLVPAVGSIGFTVTPLRPAGCAVFDGIRYNVVSNGVFVPEGDRVRVAVTEGNRIVVVQI